MATTVIGLFEDHDTAQQVRGELVKAGCDQDAVVIFSDQGGNKLVQELVERGYTEDRAQQYAQAVEQGGIVIAAEADDADQAVAVMNRFDLKTPEQLIERAGGQKGGRREEEVERAQSVEEEMRVGKEKVAGGKRLVTNVTEREVEKPVTLREEKVEVERSREDRRLSPEEADQAFEEKTAEVTATSERPVVSKQARVTEEVALRKSVGEREETVSGTVRSSEVKVEDKPQKGKRDQKA